MKVIAKPYSTVALGANDDKVHPCFTGMTFNGNRYSLTFVHDFSNGNICSRCQESVVPQQESLIL